MSRTIWRPFRIEFDLLQRVPIPHTVVHRSKIHYDMFTVQCLHAVFIYLVFVCVQGLQILRSLYNPFGCEVFLTLLLVVPRENLVIDEFVEVSSVDTFTDASCLSEFLLDVQIQVNRLFSGLDGNERGMVD